MQHSTCSSHTTYSASILTCQACSPMPSPRAWGRLLCHLPFPFLSFLSSARFTRLRRGDVKSRLLDITSNVNINNNPVVYSNKSQQLVCQLSSQPKDNGNRQTN
eukprot:104362-Pelagomonas_calceolata.AAC.21